MVKIKREDLYPGKIFTPGEIEEIIRMNNDENEETLVLILPDPMEQFGE